MSPEQSPNCRGSVPLKRRWSTGNCVNLCISELSGLVTSSPLFHAMRLSPSRVSIESGFVSAESSFPGSPESLTCAGAPIDSPIVSYEHAHPLELVQEQEDEPLAKRLRILSSSEPESTSPSILPVFKSEPELEPEAVTICACPPSTSKFVTKLVDDDSPCCEWEECREKCYTDNQLYDHVLRVHLDQLRPFETLKPPAPTQQKTRANRRRNVAMEENDDAKETDKYECRWGECEMTLTRGDDKKKFEWLVNHYTTRHAIRAQPFSCVFEGCAIRFRTQKLLIDHVRTAHDDKKPVRKHVEEKIEADPKTCYIWKPIVAIPSYFGIDFIDQRTREWISERVKESHGLKNSAHMEQMKTNEASTSKLLLYPPSPSPPLIDMSLCKSGEEEKFQNTVKQFPMKKTVKVIAELFGSRKQTF